MRARLALVAVLSLSAGSASGAEITWGATHPAPDDISVSVRLRGDIAPGDATRLAAAITAARNSGKPLYGVYLDSPGGDVAEGARLAMVVRREAVDTLVGNNRTCASACFMVLAAGAKKYIRGGARVGVHGAAEDGRETADATYSTVMMARLVAELGVPPSIVGRMVLTPPSRMVWLTPAELRTMEGMGRVSAPDSQ